MAVDTSEHIGNFNEAIPTIDDFKAEGPANFQQIKRALKLDFGQIKGAVTASHIELSYSAGLTAAIQGQLNGKAPINDAALTGAPTAPTPTLADATGRIATVGTVISYSAVVDGKFAAYAPLASPQFTGAPRAPTASAGASGSQVATLDFVNAVAFLGPNLPGQAGNAGGLLTTDGTNASWYTAPHTLPLMNLGVI